MEDTIRLTGIPPEREVLIQVLKNQKHHAKQRYDPTFVPAPGKKDRNLETIRLCDEMVDLLEGSPEMPLDLDTTDDMRRVIRNGLERHVKYCTNILNRMADTAPAKPEAEATVERRQRYA